MKKLFAYRFEYDYSNTVDICNLKNSCAGSNNIFFFSRIGVPITKSILIIEVLFL